MGNNEMWLLNTLDLDVDFLEPFECGSSPITYSCPIINLYMGGINVKALVDSGSQASIVSESIYLKMIDINQHIPSLPIRQIHVTLANGKRTKLANKQICISFKISQVVFEHVFLVMPGLIHDVIIGSDFMNLNDCKIDYQNRLFICRGEQLTFDFGIREIPSQLMCIQEISIDSIIKEMLNNVFLVNLQLGEQFCKLMCNYKYIFSKVPGIIKGYVHRIKLKVDEAFQQKMYPIPYQYQAEVQKQIDKMLEWDIIQKQSSAYVNPLVIVKKKDGTIRVCLDARKLNQITVPERDIPPPVHELLIKFKGKSIFSTFDLTASYWQIPLHEDDRKYTAFRFQGQIYVFKRMPFGLINSGAGLIRCLDMIFSRKLKEKIIMYVDDIVIASSTFEEHLEHLKMFFEECLTYNIKINLQKCIIAGKEITFLGHLINEQGIKPHPDKINAIQNFPTPQTKKQLKSFLGLCNYYNKFYANFANDTEYLSVLLKKTERWKWNKNHNDEFEKIKNKFLQKIILAYPDFKQAFYVQTDSSHFGLGVILYQVDKDQHPQVLYFLSRHLRGAELNYSITEKEALAVVWAFQKLRQFLLGSEVIVLTDHRSLEFLNKSYLNNERLIRWSLYLQQFNYRIVYIEGIKNIPADVLSRNPVRPLVQNPNMQNIVINSIDVDLHNMMVDEYKNLSESQKLDSKLSRIIDVLQNMTSEDSNKKYVKRIVNHYKLENNILMHKVKVKTGIWKIMVPQVLINKLIMYTHCMYGHYGAPKIFYVLRPYFYWLKMFKSIVNVISCCKICLQTKIQAKSYVGIMQPILPRKPNELLAIDFYGPLPPFNKKKFILVMYDIFSKFVSAYAVSKTDAKGVIKCFVDRQFPIIGKPKVILSDHATAFISNKWKNWIKSQDIKHVMCSIRNPQSNPCERIMRELGRLYRVYIQNDHRQWVKKLPEIINYINITVNESTGFTPIRLHYGQYEPLLIKMPIIINRKEINIIKDQKEAFERLKVMGHKRVKKSRYRPHPFKVNDYVLIRTPHVSNVQKNQFKKFLNLYEGPCKIVHQVGENAFMLLTPDGIRGTYNARSLIPYTSPGLT